jgi:signal transduction histidine kinase
VLADRDRLTQVVINLLSNAVKFVPGRHGKVHVRVR